MILIIDNYDSFTYNLVQLVATRTCDYLIVQNNTLSVSQIAEIQPDGILISPGPGRPENAGICVDVIRTLGPKLNILGVCLGHQAIGYTFGCQIIQAPELLHGKTSNVYHDSKGIFTDLPNPFTATRYHSLTINWNNISPEIKITAITKEGTIMGIRHVQYPIQGVQFHPESILTPTGKMIIANWINQINNHDRFHETSIG